MSMNRRDLLLAAASLPALALPARAQAMRDRPIGLILVGASWCPFCKAAANTLFASAEPASIPVLIASQDGKPIPPYGDFVEAAGHPIARDIVQIPTLLFVHLPSQAVIHQISGFRNPRSYLGQIRSTLVQAQEAGYV
ncbi:conjugal transfer protein TraF [Cereibacter changlensis]|nr:conjugal transfer protein TraF [Cereibacter changlensis]